MTTTHTTILVIEDDELVRKAVAALLQNGPYRIEFADNGKKGLERAGELCPDLILLDIMMPGMDGFEVCRRVRADPQLAEVPVIMVTALDDQASRLQGLEAGADDFISKPYNGVELRARVGTIARLNRYRRLLAERNKFAWLVEHSEEAYLLLDEEGVCGYANPTAQSYLHLPRRGGEFLAAARRHYRLVPQVSWETWPYRNESPAPRCLIRPESEKHPALWLEVDSYQVSPHPEDGFLVYLRDVSRKMLLEQQNWSFQRMLSHKLRTPMVTGQILRLLKDRLAGQVDESTRGFIDMALENAERQNRQIEKVLRQLQLPLFTPSGADGAFRLGDLPALLAGLREELGLAEQAVTLDLPEALRNRKSTLSARGMDSVLRELLENAKKFHPRQDPRIQVGVEEDGAGQCVLYVGDDGRGLAAEELGKLWLPYYQVDKHFTGEVPGMGLGLYIVASVVWSAGGNCRAENRADGTGLRIALTLPLAPSAAPP